MIGLLDLGIVDRPFQNTCWNAPISAARPVGYIKRKQDHWQPELVKKFTRAERDPTTVSVTPTCSTVFQWKQRHPGPGNFQQVVVIFGAVLSVFGSSTASIVLSARICIHINSPTPQSWQVWRSFCDRRAWNTRLERKGGGGGKAKGRFLNRSPWDIVLYGLSPPLPLLLFKLPEVDSYLNK